MKKASPTHTLLKRFDVDLERIRCTYFTSTKDYHGTSPSDSDYILDVPQSKAIGHIKIITSAHSSIS